MNVKLLNQQDPWDI